MSYKKPPPKRIRARPLRPNAPAKVETISSDRQPEPSATLENPSPASRASRSPFAAANRDANSRSRAPQPQASITSANPVLVATPAPFSQPDEHPIPSVVLAGPGAPLRKTSPQAVEARPPSDPALGHANPKPAPPDQGERPQEHDTQVPSAFARFLDEPESATPSQARPAHPGARRSKTDPHRVRARAISFDPPTTATASPAQQTADRSPAIDPISPKAETPGSVSPARHPAISNVHEPETGERHFGNEAHLGSALPDPIDDAAGVATPNNWPRRPRQRPLALASQIASLNHNALPVLVQLWRQRQDLRRALQRLDLQCQATIRRSLGGDREEAAKTWAALKSGKLVNNDLVVILSPYRAAMTPLEEAATALEKQCEKIVAEMAIWTNWAKDVKGLGKLSLAGLLGEAGVRFGAYKSVSALWKRFGLAVIEGERQRKKADVDLALLHGYSPTRRSYAYVISTNLMRSQRAGDAFRDLYDKRKAYELERAFVATMFAKEGEDHSITPAHAHNRALRVMVKELLKHAWRADRAQFLSAANDTASSASSGAADLGAPIPA